jgi:hypothetical protein
MCAYIYKPWREKVIRLDKYLLIDYCNIHTWMYVVNLSYFLSNKWCKQQRTPLRFIQMCGAVNSHEKNKRRSGYYEAINSRCRG